MVHICVLVSALGACIVYVYICVHVCSHMWHMHLYDVYSSHGDRILLPGACLTSALLSLLQVCSTLELSPLFASTV